MSPEKETELYRLFRRNFPFAVREEKTARAILADERNHVLEQRDSAGKLIGASVLHKNTLYLLCVDAAYRNRGLGSQLLKESEALVKAGGYDTIQVGAGEEYLTPGIPTGTKPFEEPLGKEALCPGLTNEAVRFFQKRGYIHAWGEANCFDMRTELQKTEFPKSSIGDTVDGVLYRWADAEDLPGICACVDSAESDFTRYYRNPALYRNENERVLLALQDKVCGALIVSAEAEAPGLGSVGCTAVAPEYRGRHIGVNLTVLGTKYLKELGLREGFLGYTYSGLDKMYGYAGYEICCYYYMAQKALNGE